MGADSPRYRQIERQGNPGHLGLILPKVIGGGMGEHCRKRCCQSLAKKH
jgi:hypothetical protein